MGTERVRSCFASFRPMASRPMARSLRIEFPGAVYHITSRGNAREAIALADDDREAARGAVLRGSGIGHP